ncbi:MAG: ATP-grasp domain-containing protein [Gemmataceae bacterium]
MPGPRPFAFYTHSPEQFADVFAECGRRGRPVAVLDPAVQGYNPAAEHGPWAVVVNGICPSHFRPGADRGLFHTLAYLTHLEHTGVPVVNGAAPFLVGLSKARQLTVFQSLGQPYPAARVLNHPSHVADAAESLRFPVLVKPTIGGRSEPLRRFDNPLDLVRVAADGRLDRGLDQTAIIQEYIPPRDGLTQRILTLGGRAWYAVQMDVHETIVGEFDAPTEVLNAVEEVVQDVGLDVGAVDYLIDDRTGARYLLAVRAVTQLPTEPERVHDYVDFLERTARVGVPFRAERRKTLLNPDAEYWDAAL